MTTRIAKATLALGFVSGAATAGPLADVLGNVTGALGGSGLTGGVATTINGITSAFNGSPLSGLTTLPTVDPAGGSLVGIGAFEGAATGNGQLVGVGAGNDNQNGQSGSGGLVGLGALQSGNIGNSDTIGVAALTGGESGNGGLVGVGALTGDNAGNGGLIGVSALSSGGGNSGQGGLLGVELLNGDTVLGLNSGMAGQSADIIPNPTGMSGNLITEQVTGTVGEPLRDGLQSALQRGGDISGPLEGLVVTLDDALVAPLGDGLAPITDQLAPLAGVGIDGDGQSPGGFASLANAVVTGNSGGGNGSDINAGVISNESDQGNGDVVGAGAFSGDNAGGGMVSVGAISGGNSGKGGDVNAGVANSGDGATSDGGGILSLGVANTESPACTGPTCGGGKPTPPVDVPNLLVTNGKAEENCASGSEHNETGLRGAGQLTQFNSRNAREEGCQDIRLQQLSSNL